MFHQSMQIRGLGRYLILALLLLFGANTVFAQDIASSDDQYVVNDIVANASGKTPNQARTNAISSGQRNAFLILLGRLGVDEKIGNGFDNTKIADMVLSQQIMNEKITRNNYSATLNLKFSESFVKHYLGKNLISAGDKNSILTDSFLIVPVKSVQIQPLIWEDENNWRTAIKNAINNISKNNIAPLLKIPQGDIDDIAVISPYNINNINFTDIEPMLDKYKVSSLMLVYFDFDSLENKVNITLLIVKKFATTSTKLEFINVNQLTQDELINKVANKTISYITNINNDQQSTKSISQGISSYQIDILISDLSDWLKVKNKLENSNVVSQFNVESISRDLVKINASYNNNNGDIIRFFAKNNLFLHNNREGGYILSLGHL